MVQNGIKSLSMKWVSIAPRRVAKQQKQWHQSQTCSSAGSHVNASGAGKGLLAFYVLCPSSLLGSHLYLKSLIKLLPNRTREDRNSKWSELEPGALI